MTQSNVTLGPYQSHISFLFFLPLACFMSTFILQSFYPAACSVFVCTEEDRKLSLDGKNWCLCVSVSRLRATHWAHSIRTNQTEIWVCAMWVCVCAAHTCMCTCVFLFKMHYISLSYSSVDNWFGEIVLSVCGYGGLLSHSLLSVSVWALVCVCVNESAMFYR